MLLGAGGKAGKEHATIAQHQDKEVELLPLTIFPNKTTLAPISLSLLSRECLEPLSNGSYSFTLYFSDEVLEDGHAPRVTLPFDLMQERTRR